MTAALTIAALTVLGMLAAAAAAWPPFSWAGWAAAAAWATDAGLLAARTDPHIPAAVSVAALILSLRRSRDRSSPPWKDPRD